MSDSRIEDIWACLGRDGKTFLGWTLGKDLHEVERGLLNSRHGEPEARRTYFVTRAGSEEIVRVLPDDYHPAVIIWKPEERKPTNTGALEGKVGRN